MAGSAAVSVLTAVHHEYGARLYHAPWRRYAFLVSGAATVVAAGALAATRRQPANRIGVVGLFVFALVTVANVGFGIWERGYNHLVKDVMFLGGASERLMRRLFPPPRYELPNNILFEATGILQLVPTGVAAYSLVRAAQLHLSDQDAEGGRPEPVAVPTQAG